MIIKNKLLNSCGIKIIVKDIRDFRGMSLFVPACFGYYTNASVVCTRCEFWGVAGLR